MADDVFSDGFGRELGDVSLELDRIGRLADGVSRSLTNAFRGAITEGRSLRTLLADIGKAFADIALRAALKPVGNLVGGLVESLFTATNPALGGVTAFAKGGVIAAPAYFGMGNGRMGLMGEAGPEAILPLARGSDGRLGVATGGGAGAVNVTFNVTSPDARSFRASEAEVSAMLLRAVRRGTRGS
ncbi:phage tail tape measure protein [Arsenicitalea aurantiaca]|uniref:Phage tail tape measure protein n=1 Tax=Arsenicitalea aurantiaca TaxID=1783274 RepID=A0A433XBG2_9HYPH|nr:phage tail tape measure protein [Arsenicitalea aurantiaca]